MQGKEGVEANIAGDASFRGFAKRQERRVDSATASVIYQDGEVEVVEGSTQCVKVGGRCRCGTVRLMGVRLAGHRTDAVQAGYFTGVGDENAKRPVGMALLQLRHDERELVVVTAMQHDVEPLLGELSGKATADAVRGAGDQGPRRLAVGAVGISGYTGGQQVDAHELNGPRKGNGGCEQADGGKDAR